MTTYTITAGVFEDTYEAADEAAAILAYVTDAGYASVEDAAAACGQTRGEFLDDIFVTAR